MNHRPFEDWLLSEEPLTSKEKRALQDHLQTCSQCAALAEVDLALKSVKVAAPDEGFASRFQVRLVAQKKALRRRNFWGFLILVLSVAVIVFGFSWPVIQVAVQSPVNLLASWLSFLVTLWAWIQAMGHVGSVLLHIAPGIVPVYVWPAALIICSAWILMWIYSLMKFSKKQQGV